MPNYEMSSLDIIIKLVFVNSPALTIDGIPIVKARLQLNISCEDNNQ
jgi:hypothetical protein